MKNSDKELRKSGIPEKLFEEWNRTCEVAMQVKTGLRKIVLCKDGKYYAVKNH